MHPEPLIGRGAERRRFVRYLVAGDVRFRAGDAAAERGELLDIGTGGILVRSQAVVDKGTNINADFTVNGFDGSFSAKCRVVRSQMDVLAVMFVEPPANLDPLLDHLAEKGRAAP